MQIENHIPSDNINLVELNKWAGYLMCETLGYENPIDSLKKEMSEIDA